MANIGNVFETNISVVIDDSYRSALNNLFATVKDTVKDINNLRSELTFFDDINSKVTDTSNKLELLNKSIKFTIDTSYTEELTKLSNTVVSTATDINSVLSVEKIRFDIDDISPKLASTKSLVRTFVDESNVISKEITPFNFTNANSIRNLERLVELANNLKVRDLSNLSEVVKSFNAPLTALEVAFSNADKSISKFITSMDTAKTNLSKILPEIRDIGKETYEIKIGLKFSVPGVADIAKQLMVDRNKVEEAANDSKEVITDALRKQINSIKKVIQEAVNSNDEYSIRWDEVFQINDATFAKINGQLNEFAQNIKTSLVTELGKVFTNSLNLADIFKSLNLSTDEIRKSISNIGTTNIELAPIELSGDWVTKQSENIQKKLIQAFEKAIARSTDKIKDLLLSNKISLKDLLDTSIKVDNSAIDNVNKWVELLNGSINKLDTSLIIKNINNLETKLNQLNKSSINPQSLALFNGELNKLKSTLALPLKLEALKSIDEYTDNPEKIIEYINSLESLLRQMAKMQGDKIVESKGESAFFTLMELIKDGSLSAEEKFLQLQKTVKSATFTSNLDSLLKDISSLETIQGKLQQSPEIKVKLTAEVNSVSIAQDVVINQESLKLLQSRLNFEIENLNISTELIGVLIKDIQDTFNKTIFHLYVDVLDETLIKLKNNILTALNNIKIYINISLVDNWKSIIQTIISTIQQEFNNNPIKLNINKSNDSSSGSNTDSGSSSSPKGNYFDDIQKAAKLTKTEMLELASIIQNNSITSVDELKQHLDNLSDSKLKNKLSGINIDSTITEEGLNKISEVIRLHGDINLKDISKNTREISRVYNALYDDLVYHSVIPDGEKAIQEELIKSGKKISDITSNTSNQVQENNKIPYANVELLNKEIDKKQAEIMLMESNLAQARNSYSQANMRNDEASMNYYNKVILQIVEKLDSKRLELSSLENQKIELQPEKSSSFSNLRKTVTNTISDIKSSLSSISSGVFSGLDSAIDISISSILKFKDILGSVDIRTLSSGFNTVFSGISATVRSTFDISSSLIGSFIRNISSLNPFSPLITNAEHVEDVLVGHSIIPDMLTSAKSYIDRFQTYISGADFMNPLSVNADENASLIDKSLADIKRGFYESANLQNKINPVSTIGTLSDLNVKSKTTVDPSISKNMIAQLEEDKKAIVQKVKEIKSELSEVDKAIGNLENRKSQVDPNSQVASKIQEKINEYKKLKTTLNTELLKTEKQGSVLNFKSNNLFDEGAIQEQFKQLNAIVKSSISNLSKNTPKFNLVKLNYEEVLNEYNKAKTILNSKSATDVAKTGAIDTLTNSFAKLEDILSQVNNIDKSPLANITTASEAEINRLTEKFNSANVEVTNFGKIMNKAGDVISGGSLFLASGNITNKLVGLRQALFGVGESSSIGAKGIDLLSDIFVNNSNAMSTFTVGAESLAKNMVNVNAIGVNQTKTFKELAASFNIPKTEFSQLDQLTQKVRNEWVKMLSSIQSTGEVSEGQLANLKNQIASLTDTAATLQRQGVIPEGTVIDDAFSSLLKNISGNEIAVTNLIARMNEAKQATTGMAQSSNMQVNTMSSGFRNIALILAGVSLAIAGYFLKITGLENIVSQTVTKVVGWFTNMKNKIFGIKPFQPVLDQALYMEDELVGHSIVPDMVKSVINWFGKMATGILSPITFITDTVLGGFKLLASGSMSALASFPSKIKDLILSPLHLISYTLSSVKQNFMFTFGIDNLIQNLYMKLQQVLGQFNEFNDLYQNTTLTLEGMWQTEGSIDQINASVQGFYKTVESVTAKTSFTINNMIAEALSLTKMGYDTESWLTAVGNAASAEGRAVGEFDNALSKLAGGSMGMAIDSFRDLGVPVKEARAFIDQATGAVLTQQELLTRTGGRGWNSLVEGMDYAQYGLDMLETSFTATGRQIAKINGEIAEDNVSTTQKIFQGYFLQSEVYATAAESRSRSLSGAMSNLSDIFTQAMIAFGQPIFENLAISINKLLAYLNPLVPSMKAIFDYMGTEVANVISNFTSNIENGTSVINSIIEVVKQLTVAFSLFLQGNYDESIGNIIYIFEDMLISIENIFYNFTSEAFDWGINLMEQVADGIYEGSSQYIEEAVAYVSDTISSYLEPHSPPEEGALSTIDKWGKPLMGVFLGGFSDADLSLINNITDPLQNIFKNVDTGEIDISAFKAVRGNVEAIISEINSTGNINEGLFSQITAQLGPANQLMSDLIRSELELKQVNKEVDDARSKGFVSQELLAKQAAAKKKVSTAEQDLKLGETNQKATDRSSGVKDEGSAQSGLNNIKNDTNRLDREHLDNQNKLNESKQKEIDTQKKSTEKEKQSYKDKYNEELTLLEQQLKFKIISEEEYYQQLASLKKKYAQDALKEGDTDVVAKSLQEAADIELKLNDIKSKAKIENLAKELSEEKLLLQQKLDYGLITQEEYTKGLISAEQKYIDASMKEGVLFGIDEHINELNKLNALSKSANNEELLMLEEKYKLGLINEEQYLSSIKSLKERYAEESIKSGNIIDAQVYVNEAKSIEDQISQIKLKSAQENSIKELETEKQLLLDKLNLKLITQEEYNKSLLSAEQRYVEESVKSGTLSNIQTHIDSINRLKELTEKANIDEIKLLKDKRANNLITEEEYLSQLKSIKQKYMEESFKSGDISTAKQQLLEIKDIESKINTEKSKEKLNQLKEELSKEQQLLKDKLKFNLITQEDYVKGLISSEQKYIESSLQSGVLFGLDAHVKELNNLKSATGKASVDELDRLKKEKEVGLLTQEEYLTQVKSLKEKYAKDALSNNDIELARKLASEALVIEDQLLKEKESKKLAELAKELSAEKKLLDLKLKLGLITHDEYTKNLISSEEKYVNSSVENGVLFGLDKHIEQLNKLKSLSGDSGNKLDKQFELLKRSYDAGLIDEEEYLNSTIKLRQDYVDDASKSSDLVSDFNLKDNSVDSLKQFADYQYLQIELAKNRLDEIKLLAAKSTRESSGDKSQFEKFGEIKVPDINKVLEDWFNNTKTLTNSKFSDYKKTWIDNLKSLIPENITIKTSALGFNDDIIININEVKNTINNTLFSIATSISNFSKNYDLSRLFSIEGLKSIFTDINNYINSVVKSITDTFKQWIMGITSILVFYKLISQSTSSSIGTMFSTITSFLSSMLSFIGNRLSLFINIITAIPTRLFAIIKTITNIIKSISIWNIFITSAIYGIYTNKELLVSIFDEILLLLDDRVSTLIELLHLPKVYTNIEGVIAILTNYVSMFINHILYVINKLSLDLNIITSSITKFFTGFFTVIGSLIEIYLIGGIDLITAVIAIFTGEVKQTTGIFDTIWSTLFGKAKLSSNIILKLVNLLDTNILRIFTGISLMVEELIKIIPSLFISIPIALLELLGLEDTANILRLYRDTFIESIGNVFTSIREALINYYSIINISETINNLFKLFDAIRLLTVSIFTQLSKLFNVIGTFIGENISIIINKFIELYNKLAIILNLPEIKLDFSLSTKSIQDFVIGFYNSINSISDVVNIIVVTLTSLITSITLLINEPKQVFADIQNWVMSTIKWYMFILDLISSSNLTYIIIRETFSSWQGFLNTIEVIFLAFTGRLSKLKLAEYITGLFKISDVPLIVNDTINATIKSFEYLYDVLVGHSIVPDLVAEIANNFTKMYINTKATMEDIHNDTISQFNGIFNYIFRFRSIFGKLSIVDKYLFGDLEMTILYLLDMLKSSISYGEKLTSTFYNIFSNLSKLNQLKVLSLNLESTKEGLTTANTLLTSLKNNLTTATQARNAFATSMEAANLTAAKNALNSIESTAEFVNYQVKLMEYDLAKDVLRSSTTTAQKQAATTALNSAKAARDSAKAIFDTVKSSAIANKTAAEAAYNTAKTAVLETETLAKQAVTAQKTVIQGINETITTTTKSIGEVSNEVGALADPSKLSRLESYSLKIIESISSVANKIKTVVATYSASIDTLLTSNVTALSTKYSTFISGLSPSITSTFNTIIIRLNSILATPINVSGINANIITILDKFNDGYNRVRAIIVSTNNILMGWLSGTNTARATQIATDLDSIILYIKSTYIGFFDEIRDIYTTGIFSTSGKVSSIIGNIFLSGITSSYSSIALATNRIILLIESTLSTISVSGYFSSIIPQIERLLVILSTVTSYITKFFLLYGKIAFFVGQRFGQILGVVISAVSKLIVWIKPLIVGLIAFTSAIPGVNVAVWVLVLIGNITLLIDVLKYAYNSINQFLDVMGGFDKLASELSIIFSEISNIISLTFSGNFDKIDTSVLYNKVSDIAKALGTALYDNLHDMFKPAIDLIYGLFTGDVSIAKYEELVSNLLQTINKFVNTITYSVHGMASGFEDSLPPLSDGIWNTIYPILSNIARVVFSVALSTIKIFIKNGIPLLLDVIAMLGSILLDTINGFISVLGTSFNGLIYGIINVLFGNTIAGYITSITDPIVNGIVYIFTSMSEIIRNIILFIASPIDYIQNVVLKSFNNIGDIIETFADIITSPFKYIADVISNTLDFLTSDIFTVINNLSDSTLDIISNMINSIINIFYYLYDVLVGHSIVPDTVNEIINWFTSLITWINNNFSNGLNIILTVFNNIFTNTISIFKSFYSYISTIVSNIVNSIITAFYYLYDVLLGHSIIPDIYNGIMFIFKELLTNLTFVFDGIISLIISAFKTIYNNIGIIGTIFTTINNIVNDVSTKIANFIVIISGLIYIFNTILSVVMSILDSISLMLNITIKLSYKLVVGIFSLLSAIFSYIYNNKYISGIVNNIEASITAIFTKIKNVLMNNFNIANNYMKGLLLSGISYFSNIISSIISTFSKIKSNISNIFNGVSNYVYGIFDSNVKTVSSFGNSIIGIFNNVKSYINSIYLFTDDILSNTGRISEVFSSLFPHLSAIYKYLTDTSVKGVDFIGVISKNLNRVMSKLSNSLQPLFNRIGNSFVKLANTIKIAFGQLSSRVSIILKGLQVVFSGIFNKLYNIIYMIGVIIKKSLPEETLFAKLYDIIYKLGVILNTVFAKPAIQVALKIILSLIESTVIVLGTLLAIISGTAILSAITLLLGIITGFVEGLVTFLDGITNIITGIIDSLRGLFLIIKGVVELIYSVITFDKVLFDDSLDTIRRGVKIFAEGVYNIIYGIFESTIGTIYSAVKGLIVGMAQFIADMLIETFGRDTINNYINWFNTVIDNAVNYISKSIDVYINGLYTFINYIKNIFNTIQNMWYEFSNYILSSDSPTIKELILLYTDLSNIVLLTIGIISELFYAQLSDIQFTYNIILQVYKKLAENIYLVSGVIVAASNNMYIGSISNMMNYIGKQKTIISEFFASLKAAPTVEVIVNAETVATESSSVISNLKSLKVKSIGIMNSLKIESIGIMDSSVELYNVKFTRVAKIYESILKMFNEAFVNMTVKSITYSDDLFRMLGMLPSKLGILGELGSSLFSGLSKVFTFLGKFFIPLTILLTMLMNFRTFLPLFDVLFAGIIQIARSALNIISGVINIIYGIFTLDINRVMSGFGYIISGIALFFKGLSSIVISLGIGILQIVVFVVRDILDLIGGAFWLVGLEPVANLFYYLAESLNNFSSYLTTTVSEATTIMNNLSNQMFTIWTLLSNRLSVTTSQLTAIIIYYFNYLYDILVGHSIIPDLVNSIINWFGILYTNSDSIFNSIGNAIYSIFNSIYTYTSDIVVAIYNLFIDRFSNIPLILAVLFYNVSTMFTNMFNQIILNISNIDSVLLFFVDKLVLLFMSILTIIQDTINNITSPLMFILFTLSTYLTEVLNGIMSTVSNIPLILALLFNDIKTMFISIGESFYLIGVNIINYMLNGMKSAWVELYTWLSTSFNNIKPNFDSIPNALIESMNKSGVIIQQGVEYIASWLPFSPAKRGPLSNLTNFDDHTINPLSNALTESQNSIETHPLVLPNVQISTKFTEAIATITNSLGLIDSKVNVQVDRVEGAYQAKKKEVGNDPTKLAELDKQKAEYQDRGMFSFGGEEYDWLVKYDEELAKNKELSESINQSKEDQLKIESALKEAQDNYNKELAKLDVQLKGGYITQDNYNTKLAELNKTLTDKGDVNSAYEWKLKLLNDYLKSNVINQTEYLSEISTLNKDYTSAMTGESQGIFGSSIKFVEEYNSAITKTKDNLSNLGSTGLEIPDFSSGTSPIELPAIPTISDTSNLQFPEYNIQANFGDVLDGHTQLNENIKPLAKETSDIYSTMFTPVNGEMIPRTLLNNNIVSLNDYNNKLTNSAKTYNDAIFYVRAEADTTTKNIMDMYSKLPDPSTNLQGYNEALVKADDQTGVLLQSTYTKLSEMGLNHQQIMDTMKSSMSTMSQDSSSGMSDVYQNAIALLDSFGVSMTNSSSLTKQKLQESNQIALQGMTQIFDLQNQMLDARSVSERNEINAQAEQKVTELQNTLLNMGLTKQQIDQIISDTYLSMRDSNALVATETNTLLTDMGINTQANYSNIATSVNDTYNTMGSNIQTNMTNATNSIVSNANTALSVVGQAKAASDSMMASIPEWMQRVNQNNGYADKGHTFARDPNTGRPLQQNSYDKGSWDILEDQVAMVHKGELIVPAKTANIVRPFLDSISNGTYQNLDSLSNIRYNNLSNDNKVSNSSNDTYTVDITLPNVKTGRDAVDIVKTLNEISKSSNIKGKTIGRK